MKYNKLGRTGLDVSIIGLGMEHLTSPEKIAPVVHRAIDQGINYIDLMIWSSELKDALGVALKGRRDNGILADHLQADYGSLPVKASDCIECGDCLECCPFEVDVISKMEQTVELFEV
jgi:predicted aldo/keto reductase-like oxidoreductase